MYIYSCYTCGTVGYIRHMFYLLLFAHKSDGYKGKRNYRVLCWITTVSLGYFLTSTKIINAFNIKIIILWIINSLSYDRIFCLESQKIDGTEYSTYL